jgi:2-C-methyl-D-erythritol 2,4-cyclodiphosphate synthase
VTATTPVIRVGIGYDTHRLRPGGPLRLGGVDVPHDRESAGYSDADVLMHAIADALLGAAALGDIGEMFPDTDSVNEDRDSAEMLRAAYDAVTAAGWQIGNLDCIVLAERPKLTPYKQAIRERLAAILGIEPDRLSVKAKSGEQVGPIGREEIIAAQCVALLVPR